MAASVKDKILCSKVRVYQWNEIVHDTDKGDDLMVFVIKNQFLINNFPSKIPDPADLALARAVLCGYGFINLRSRFLTDDDGWTNIRGVLCSYSDWKDLVKFDRRWLSDSDFGYKMLKALDPGLFLLDEQALVHLGKQISANFNCRFQSGLDSKSRIVVKVEIYRARTIEFDSLFGLTTTSQDPLLHETLLKSFPRNPFMKIPQAAFDPYFELGFETEYDERMHKLVTDCDMFDEFIPEDDEIGAGMFEILGFMRARMFSLYPPPQEMLGVLRNRSEGRESAGYPYKKMSPEEATGLVEVEPFHPRPLDTICPICLDNTDYYSKADTCCFHTFHADCLSQWIYKTPSCPLCRIPL